MDQRQATRSLGIIGGMSWVSTAEYYRQLNRAVGTARGRQHSADLWLASVDFQEIVDAQVSGAWDQAGELLAEKARGLERAGAGAFLIASNTMHKVLAQVKNAVAIPPLDIFDATATAVLARGLVRVGLLGTRYTMSDGFFREEYRRRGVDVFVPEPDDAHSVNEIIFRELIHGIVTPESVTLYASVIGRLAAAGAEGVILGCTEINLLVPTAGGPLPIFDTTALHVAAAAQWLLMPGPHGAGPWPSR